MQEPSDKRPYKSRFDGGYISATQFLAESMCARQARKQGKELPPKFWLLDSYKREFKLQSMFASSLLKIYSIEAIINALRIKEGQWIMSLGLKKYLDPLIQAEERKLVNRKIANTIKEKIEPKEETKINQETEEQRPVFNNKKTMWGKLSGEEERK